MSPDTNKKPARSIKKTFQTVSGMSDTLPKDEPWWVAIRNAGEMISELYNFHFIETPIIEHAGLFESGLGKSSQTVEHQLYTFKPARGTTMALRPEGMMPVMRSYLEHHLGYFSSPLKVYYHGPMFRRGAGVRHQFHQWGFAIIGDGDPVYDMTIILALFDFLAALDFKDPVLKINAVGCRVCWPTYRQKLKNYYRYRKQELCEACKSRYNNDPLRLFNCKLGKCVSVSKNAPVILDYLCQGCNSHFQNILELVEDNEINYVPDPYLVGETGYYSKVAFRVLPDAESNLALAAGGRYDYLSEHIGGRQLQAVGGAIDIENVIKVMKEREIEPQTKHRRKVFFIAVGEQARKSSLLLISKLRRSGFIVLESLGRKSFKAQLKIAEKSGVSLTFIYGQREAFEDTVIMREMESGIQENVPLDNMISVVKKKLK